MYTFFNINIKCPCCQINTTVIFKMQLALVYTRGSKNLISVTNRCINNYTVCSFGFTAFISLKLCSVGFLNADICFTAPDIKRFIIFNNIKNKFSFFIIKTFFSFFSIIKIGETNES